eukprot:gnl/MRDRNA2_/MRDRNA2_30916_c0_seq1.p1 gnl/MRDRNA2_/MRDRNA2_30916_c0~~gnl/MRDRNA2_/MRDRNA2_30916_c0_seq1.p1  ORF type:complete len:124 (+),score=26.48 gnl/MRDRNA2_/MRDRNA2_30916_c0_seq1:82-453(+)
MSAKAAVGFVCLLAMILPYLFTQSRRGGSRLAALQYEEDSSAEVIMRKPNSKKNARNNDAQDISVQDVAVLETDSAAPSKLSAGQELPTVSPTDVPTPMSFAQGTEMPTELPTPWPLQSESDA